MYLTDSHQSIPKDYPIGTSVTIAFNTSNYKGYILDVPSHTPSDSDPLYTIQRLTSGTTTVPASAMPHLIDKQAKYIQLSLPLWLKHDCKVRCTTRRVTLQGRLHIGSRMNGHSQFITS